MRGPRTWSVRLRAAAATAAALAPLLAVAAAAGILVQRHELTQATALVAEEQARTVAASVGEAGGVGDLPDPASNSLGGEETLVQVVDADTVVVASPALQTERPLVPQPPDDTPTSATVEDIEAGERDRYLVVAVRVDPGADPGAYTVAARSLEGVDEATASTTRLLAVGIPLVVALAAGLTWLLTGRALAPVDRLGRRADEISVAGSGIRLPEPAGRDEISRLALTLNAMLGRLDAAAAAQRQFVADASHELRSPVASIRTVVEVADRVETDPAEVRRDVLAEARRLELLVDALLLLARRDAAGRPDRPGTDVALAELARDQGARPRRLPVEVEITGEPHLRGDHDALGTMVGNLVDNADRHGRTSVRVTLRGDPRALAVTLTVEDDGAGVPEDDRDHVFERFVRLDDARARDAGGAGLGLAIARAVAEDHGGTLSCDTSPTLGGARFLVRLPTR